MTRRSKTALVRLLGTLIEHPAARLVPAGDGSYRLAGAEIAAAGTRVTGEIVRALRSSGLLREAGAGQFAPADAAVAWLKRQADSDLPFRRQHHALERKRLPGEDVTVLLNAEESPVAALARRRGKSGEPWLADHVVTAADRLRRDFERGRLQPRITANWSASVNSGRRTGDAAGLTALTDMALAARIRFDKAMLAVGPELSGILVDVCCFLKGLEAVERERQWPARSAKLVLRLGLEALARHYGLREAATGPAATGPMRHWGAEGYRPEVT
jgi:Domain of unknown function (DUF6456)